MLARAKAAAKQNTDTAASGPRWVYLPVWGGLQTLIDALVEQLTAKGVVLETSAPVQQWTRNDQAAAVNPRDQGWTLTLADESAVHADRLVVAGPGGMIAELASASNETDLAAAAAAVPYAGVATLSLAYDTADTAIPKGAGFVVPAVEGRVILAGTFAHQKYPDRAPENRRVIRVFLGGGMNPGILNLSDAALIERAHEELHRFGLTRAKQPLWHRLQRWPNAMAQPTSATAASPPSALPPKPPASASSPTPAKESVSPTSSPKPNRKSNNCRI